MGRFGEAVPVYRKAIALHFDVCKVHNNLGNALKACGKLDEAVVAYERAIVLEPDQDLSHSNLGSTLKDMGRLDEAIVAYRKGSWPSQPNFLPSVHGNLITWAFTIITGMTRKPLPGSGKAAGTSSMRAHAEIFDGPRAANVRNPGRRLRIGYISPDFCDHVVGRNLLPLLANHDPEGI